MTVKAEIVAIGTELLLGDIVNGNAAWLGKELATVGIDVERTTAVGDHVRRIVAVLAEACARADVVIATGGLGPTQDDLTREALAELAGVRLERDRSLEQAMVDRYAAAGRADFPPNNLRMAERPESAVALSNPAGTAPGLRMMVGDTVIFALPGVPQEMRELFRSGVRDDLVGLAGAGLTLVSRELHTVGLWESEVSQALAGLDAELDGRGNPTIAYLAAEGQTRVRITAKAATRPAAESAIADVESRVRALLGDAVYGVDDETLESVVHELLLAQEATVATAESLTGGLLGAALTTTPGSSASYRGGAIVYATEAKAAALGVPAELLAERGAVDPDVALAMAAGARQRFGADYGLATTGVAGPAEQDGRPVGTVYVALTGPAIPDVVRAARFGGGRARIRRATVQLALDLLRRRLAGLPIETR